MVRSILGTVLCGVAFGALAFFVPHFLIGIMVFFLIVRLLHCGGRHGHCGHGYGHHERLFYMADKIRKMSDEEYAEFKEKMGGGFYGGYHGHGHYHSHSQCGCGCGCGCNCGCGSKSEKCDCESKKETKE
jgi:hypothetical protein